MFCLDTNAVIAVITERSTEVAVRSKLDRARHAFREAFGQYAHLMNEARP